jgi:hypothetical protein
MATTQQPSTPASAAAPETCATCGAPLAADQRYCLSCGTRRGEPRVALPADPAPAAVERVQTVEPAAPARSSDVSPLAAVIGIALLGGMLLIGVLIGRNGGDDSSQSPIVQVSGPGGSTTTTGAGDSSTTVPTGDSGAITSEWPAGTEGYTIQLSSLSKADATPESVEAAKQSAVSSGASDAAVLDSDLYSTLPPGNYIIYSGVYTDRKSAEVGLKGLGDSFGSATVVHVAGGSGNAATGSQRPESSVPDTQIPDTQVPDSQSSGNTPNAIIPGSPEDEATTGGAESQK